MSDIIVIEDGEHSILGPSSAERWMNCPGSVLAPGVGRMTKYAAEGTAAHTLSEWVRTQGRHASEWKGKILKVGDFEFKVGKPMIESVMTFVDDVSKRPGLPLIEARIAYDEIVPGGFGTLDDGRVEDWLCAITDLKHGTGVRVFAKDNAQLKLYALGVYLKLKWLYEFDHFLLRICQPRLKHFEESEISLGTLLAWAYDVVRPAAKLALTPGAPIVAGPWCKFCKIKDSCLVRAEYKRNHETGTFARNADDELEAIDD